MVPSEASNALGLTMGVALIGCLMSAVLYGITVTQTYLYFQRFPRDHYAIKAMVALLWTMDTLHLSLISHSMYFYLVTNFSNPAALASAVWSFNLEVSINGIIGFIVECYFARRLLRLSGRSLLGWGLTIVVCTLAFIHFGLGIFFTDRLFEISRFANFPQLTWITKVGLGSAAACDMMISVSLCCYLYNARTGSRKTDSLIVTLMVYTLNCGLLTGFCAALVVIMFSAFPSSLLFMAFFWVLGKLYCNSCLAMLNSREALRGKVGLETDQISKISIPRIRRGSTLSQREPTFDIMYGTPKSPQRALTIRVDTTTDTVRDYRGENENEKEVRAETFPDRGRHLHDDVDGDASASPDSTAPLVLEGERWTYPGYYM